MIAVTPPRNKGFCKGVAVGASMMLVVSLFAALAFLKASDGAASRQRLVASTPASSKLMIFGIDLSFTPASASPPPSPTPTTVCVAETTVYRPGAVHPRSQLCGPCEGAFAASAELSRYNDPVALAACICAEAWQSNVDPDFESAALPCIYIDQGWDLSERA